MARAAGRIDIGGDDRASVAFPGVSRRARAFPRDGSQPGGVRARDADAKAISANFRGKPIFHTRRGTPSHTRPTTCFQGTRMRITIVGAGYAGSTLATELATSFDTHIDICLVGAPGNFGGGTAYGDARSEHLLNVRAGQLGATADAPGDFAEWLNLSARAGGAFLPRMAYGEYLRARLHETEESSTNLTTLEQEVVEIERLHGRGYRIHLDDGSRFDSDRVVLAVGALPPQRLPGVGPRLARDPRYVASPWQPGELDRIGRDARVLIVGTGLTMVDIVSTLSRRGHRGGIVAVSRHGLLPQAHAENAAAPVELPPRLRKTLREGDLAALVPALRRVCRRADDWRTVVDAIRPELQRCWRAMPHAVRARFLRHVRPYWESHRHRMAPKAAADIAVARADGRLRIVAGRLLRAGLIDAANTDAGLFALIRQRGEEHAERHEFDVIIRATGQDTDILRTTHPLIQHLVAAGTIVPDPLGLGLRVSRDAEALDGEGQPAPGLYCIGALARGECWEMTAVQELREAIASLACLLLRHAPEPRQTLPQPYSRDATG